MVLGGTGEAADPEATTSGEAAPPLRISPICGMWVSRIESSWSPIREMRARMMAKDPGTTRHLRRNRAASFSVGHQDAHSSRRHYAAHARLSLILDVEISFSPGMQGYDPMPPIMRPRPPPIPLPPVEAVREPDQRTPEQIQDQKEHDEAVASHKYEINRMMVILHAEEDARAAAGLENR
jgi:hypothetical protein